MMWNTPNPSSMHNQYIPYTGQRRESKECNVSVKNTLTMKYTPDAHMKAIVLDGVHVLLNAHNREHEWLKDGGDPILGHA